MSEDVKIRLKFEQEGANAFAETKAKIEQLYKAAAAYEGKGMDTAAKSARSEAKSLEKDLARDAKERANSEKAITRETKERTSAETKAAKERDAVDRARMSMLSRATRHAAGAVEGAAGGSPLGGLGSMLGGPAGIALQIGAAVTAVAAAFSRHADKVDLMRIDDRASMAVQNRHMQRLAGVDGTSASARAEEENAKDELIELHSKKERLNKEAETKWYNPMSWVRHLTGEDQDALRENDMAVARAHKRQADATRIKRDKFQEIGLKEIEIAEKRAAGDMASAKAQEMALEYHKRVKRLEAEGADPKEQIRGADAEFATQMRQREQSMAGLITAHTGARAAKRIASVALHQFQQARDSVLAQKMDEQKRLHLDTHNEAMNARTRRKFSSPPLHS